MYFARLSEEPKRNRLKQFTVKYGSGMSDILMIL